MRRATIRTALGVLLAVSPVLAGSFGGREYTEADGLPSPTVLDVAQAPDGRMWFATRAGVVAYDGAHWDQSPGAAGLTARDVGFVRFAGDGTPWAVNSRVPVSAARMIEGEWCPLPKHVVDPRQDFVVGVALANAAGETALAATTSSGGLHVWSRGDWSTVETGGRSGMVTAVLGRDGGFLVGTTEGLFQLDIEHRELLLRRADGDLGAAVAGLFPSNGGAVWLVGEDWIGRLAGGRIEVLARGLDLALLPSEGRVRGIDDGAGGALFGTPSGLFAFHPGPRTGGLERVAAPRLTGTTGLTRDREGNIWVASTRGVFKISTMRFSRLGREDGLLDDEVSAILRSSSGRIVLGHPTGLTLLGGSPRRIDLAGESLQPRVTAIAEGADGVLWAAATWYGLLRVAPDGTMTRFPVEDRFGGPTAALLIDDAGTLWSAAGGVLFRLPAGTDRMEAITLPAEAGGLGPVFVRRITAGAAGTIMLSTSNAGVIVMRDGRLVETIRSEEPASNNVFATSLRPDGGTWVGTEAGLRRIESGAIVRMGPGEPTIDRPVYFVGDDAAGRTWIGTDRGVTRLDGEKVRLFDEGHGLAGAETNREAFLALPGGEVWIGTDRGLSIYRPELDGARPGPPTVEIVAIDGAPPTFGEITVEDGELTVDLRAIAFVDEFRVRFRYSLVGHDDAWIGPQPLPERRIRYTRLPPGTYRFAVQVIDIEGQASAVARSPEVRVVGPLWRRPWFGVAAALSAGAFLWSLATSVSSVRAGRRLEREVRERTEALQRSRAEIAAERATLDAMLHHIADGVCLTDQDGTVVAWSAGATRITGRQPAAAVGRPVAEAIGLVHVDTDLDGPTPLRAEARVAVGGTRLLEIVTAIVQDPNARGRVLAFRDVTDRDRSEREAQRGQRLDALGQLAGGIAHDFNNLLMVVLGNLDLLDAAGLPPAAHGPLADTRTATQRAQRLTGQLLTFARGGSPVRQSVSIVGLIREASELLLGGSGSHIELDVPDDLWTVEVDPAQIDQVLQNLLLNARHAAGVDGRIVVRARNVAEGREALAGQRCIEVEVVDDGPGIEPANLERIFDPYFSTRVGGTGLGLSTAYSIARRHGGLLEVESRQGYGALFRLVLPAQPVAGASAEDGSQAGQFGGAGRRVLVMDDDSAVRAVVVAMLRGRGFDVETTQDGYEAVAMYRAAEADGRRFDLAILDLSVPGSLGGVAAAALILEVDPGARLMAMTGYSNDDVMAEPGRYGFLAGIAKPFSSDRLVQAVRDVLGDRPATCEPT